MRSLFSRSPDLESNQDRNAYKKGFTGDHRGRAQIPPHPSPLFSPYSHHSPFSVPSAAYRHDTIFRAPPSPSPKSGTFSLGEGEGEGEGNGGVGGNLGNSGDQRGGGIYFNRDLGLDHLDHLDQDQLLRLREYMGGLAARGTGTGNGIPQRGRRGFSMSDPNDRDRARNVYPTSIPISTSIPIPTTLPTTTPIPLSPHSRLKKNLKQKVAERRVRGGSGSASGGCGCEYDVLLGDGNREGEGKKPVMQRRGASEGGREGGFEGSVKEGGRGKEDVLPRDLGEFLEKYDPKPEDLPDVYPMNEHRAMLRTMYLEDILHATAKLHMHNWILLSRNEMYDDLRIPARWDQIQEDLEKYTRSIRNYTYWLSSPIPLLDLSKSSLPPRFHLYGKQLAILECARAWNHPRETELVHELERKLVAYHTDWSVGNGAWGSVRREARRRGWRREKGRGMGRFVGGVLGGSSILAPISILILWPGGISKTGGVGIIGVSVAIMGIMLVWIVNGRGENKSGWEGIEGERDGDGRGGVWGGEWGLKDVMLVLGAYAGVLGGFLGVAIV